MELRKTECVLTILGMLIFLSAGSQVAFGKETINKEAAEFWTPDRVHTIHVRITPQQWNMMQPTRARGLERVSASAMPAPSTRPSTLPVLTARAPVTRPTTRPEGERLEPNFYGYQFAYVKAWADIDGQRVNDVGFRMRGNSSFNWRAGYQHPFKIDFNRYVDGQKFCGLTSFYLNNNAYDPSFLRETLSYSVFRELGVPAPRTSYALVYLTIDGRSNREYLGLYTLLEDIDSKRFLNENFGPAKGLLLKPWNIRGLPYFGEQWQAYESRYNPQSQVTEAQARRVIEFVKLINYADDQTFRAKIDEYLDVDRFLRQLAGDVILSNLDTFLYTGHNFYLYLNPKDGRFCFMPWDMNLSFANFTSAASVEQHLHLSIMHPHAGEMRLIDRLLAMPQHRDAYQGHIRRFMQTSFNPEKFYPRIDSFQKVLATAEAAADEAWRARYTPPPTTRPVSIPPRPPAKLAGWQGGAAIPLKAFVERRLVSLNAQLAGETDGYSPGQRRFPAAPPGGLKAHAAYGNLPLIAAAVMRGADSDYDSQLTRAEAQAAIREFFAEADAAKQKALDRLKLATAVSRALQRVGAGRGEHGDRGARNAPRQDPALWANAVLRGIDGGNAQRVTLDQLLSAGDAAFAVADKDKSGKIDIDEILVLIDSVAASAPPGSVAAGETQKTGRPSAAN